MLLCSQRIINLAPGHMATALDRRLCHQTGPHCRFLVKFYIDRTIRKNNVYQQTWISVLNIKTLALVCSSHVTQLLLQLSASFVSNHAMLLSFCINCRRLRDDEKKETCLIKSKSMDQTGKRMAAEPQMFNANDSFSQSVSVFLTPCQTFPTAYTTAGWNSIQ